VVLVDQAGDGFPSLDAGGGEGVDVRVVEGSELISALVRPVPVEVGCVLVEDALRVTAVVDQAPVGALIPGGSDDAFGVLVAVRASRGDLGRGDVLTGEDGIERD
jgi:hypothetical protein